jgi:hypothetical protein
VFIIIFRDGAKTVVLKRFGNYCLTSANIYLIYLASSWKIRIPNQTWRGSSGVPRQKKIQNKQYAHLTDKQGVLLACNNPIAGNHNDAFKLVPVFSDMLDKLQLSSIPLDGLFLNADAGFDTEDFRTFCFKMKLSGILTRTNATALRMSIFFMSFYINVGLW